MQFLPRLRLRRATAYRLCAVILSTAVALAAGECALRISGYSPAFINALGSFHNADPVSGHRGKRGFAGRFKTPEFDVCVVHNEAGFRRQEFQNAVADATHRLHVFGDSFVWGWGVEQGEVFTDQLSRRLPSLRVENFGISGTGTVAQYELFAAECREELAPGDVVLLMFCFNDFSDNLNSTRRAAVVDGNVTSLPAIEAWHAGWKNTLQETSYLFNCASYAINRWQLERRVRRAERQAVELAAAAEAAMHREAEAAARAPQPLADTSPPAISTDGSVVQASFAAPVDEGVQSAEETTVPTSDSTITASTVSDEPSDEIPGDAATQVAIVQHYLARLRSDCQQRGVQFLVAYIPGVTELDEGGNAHTARNDRAFRRTFFDCAAAAGVDTIDLLPGMLAAKSTDNKEPLIIPADGHWTAAGHRVVASILAAQLEEKSVGGSSRRTAHSALKFAD